MSKYIGQYTATCDLCMQTKAHKRLPTGYLEPLPTPDAPWHTISVDFIVELPESDSHDMIMVVVDSLTKRAHFFPVNTMITAEGSACQFRDNVWKLHGLPTCTISDWGLQFTAAFTVEVYHLLGIKAAKTTAYHHVALPQTLPQKRTGTLPSGDASLLQCLPLTPPLLYAMCPPSLQCREAHDGTT